MNHDSFKVYINDLAKGKTHGLEIKEPAEVLEIEDSELEMIGDLSVIGEVYIAGNELILHLSLNVTAQLPCKFCNGPAEVPIEVNDLYETIEVDKLKTGIFNFLEIVKENLLIEVPFLAECNQGNCSERAEMGKYLSKEESSNKDQGQKPFANLERRNQDGSTT